MRQHIVADTYHIFKLVAKDNKSVRHLLHWFKLELRQLLRGLPFGFPLLAALPWAHHPHRASSRRCTRGSRSRPWPWG